MRTWRDQVVDQTVRLVADPSINRFRDGGGVRERQVVDGSILVHPAYVFAEERMFVRHENAALRPHRRAVSYALSKNVGVNR